MCKIMRLEWQMRYLFQMRVYFILKFASIVRLILLYGTKNGKDISLRCWNANFIYCLVISSNAKASPFLSPSKL